MWPAKKKVTTSYLYLAKKLGAEVHQFHEVNDLVPLDGGGFEVHSRESCFRVARGIRPCSARNLVCAEAFDASEPSGAELGAPGASQESRGCKHKSRSDPAVRCTAGIGHKQPGNTLVIPVRRVKARLGQRVAAHLLFARSETAGATSVAPV
jgi:hypothetical protein